MMSISDSKLQTLVDLDVDPLFELPIPIPPIPYDLYGLASIVWGGANKSIAVPVTSEYHRVSGLSVVMGSLKGITHNADGSFTNNSGQSAIVSGSIIGNGYFSGNYNSNLTAGSDISGSESPIISASGGWRPTTQLADGPISFWSSYQISLPNGKTTFPMIRNPDNTNPFLLATGKHIIRSVNLDS